MKKISVGIDVSKKTIDASVIMQNQETGVIDFLGHEKFANRPFGFRDMLRWASRLTGHGKEDMLFCCETTGVYSNALCFYMQSKGCFLWREHALTISRSIGHVKGKDDATDSRAIGDYALRFQDKAVCYKGPNPSIVELRKLLRLRARLVSDRVRYNTSRKETQENRAREDKSSLFASAVEKRIVKVLENEIKRCEERIAEIVDGSEDLSKNCRLLLSIKGIGMVNAVAILAFTDNMESVRNARKLASYYGVAPFRQQSGTSVDHRVCTRPYSNMMLKAYLSEAADSARKYDAALARYYQRMIEKGKPRGVALNNIKNKLLHIAFAVIRDQNPYNPNYVSVWEHKNAVA